MKCYRCIIMQIVIWNIKIKHLCNWGYCGSVAVLYCKKRETVLFIPSANFNKKHVKTSKSKNKRIFKYVNSSIIISMNVSSFSLKNTMLTKI